MAAGVEKHCGGLANPSLWFTIRVQYQQARLPCCGVNVAGAAPGFCLNRLAQVLLELRGGSLNSCLPRQERPVSPVPDWYAEMTAPLAPALRNAGMSIFKTLGANILSVASFGKSAGSTPRHTEYQWLLQGKPLPKPLKKLSRGVRYWPLCCAHLNRCSPLRKSLAMLWQNALKKRACLCRRLSRSGWNRVFQCLQELPLREWLQRCVFVQKSCCPCCAAWTQ